MKYVIDLNTLTKCPRCGNDTLYDVVDTIKNEQHKYCPRCYEHIHAMPPELRKATEEAKNSKEQFVLGLREEINNLKWHAHTVNEAALVEQISLVLTRIVDYIEEH